MRGAGVGGDERCRCKGEDEQACNNLGVAYLYEN